MSWPILTFTINYEPDVVAARQRARQLAALVGFEAQDQTRIATAVSEIARNAFNYAGGGKVEFALEGRTPPQVLLIRISDRGPGIADLRTILRGEYHSPTGMGLGILGARRLMDQCEITSSPQGTTVCLKKILPPKAPLVTTTKLQTLTAELTQVAHQSPWDEVKQQNQELLHTLEQLRQRQEELAQLNRELEDTNRGVVALYAELDERADYLRRADEAKTRFLSEMSHEFRTPLNAIHALAGLLLDRLDGDLTPEQEKQVRLIRRSAEELTEVVNDLLDLAKIEAGRVSVHPAEFEVANLFSALRGMLRPLLLNQSIALVFEEPADVPPLDSDEGKVSQILRNFISNALKFTERGEVRVSARLSAEDESVVFAVADTGIGIATEDQERIFEEFAQVEIPLQKRVKGTGLGLPLCRKLATLLGGSVSVVSTPGLGSMFTAKIPLRYPATATEWQRESTLAPAPDPQILTGLPLLVVEDSTETQFIYEKYLRGSRFYPLAARTIREAQQALLRTTPAAILLDIMLMGEAAWNWLAKLKENDATRDLPVLVVTTVEDRQKALALGADAYCLKPLAQSWLLEQLERLVPPPLTLPTLLVIDDHEPARYLLRKLLTGAPYNIQEAASGEAGLQAARLWQPQVILLDLSLPGISGYEVLEALRQAPATRETPVIVVTGERLDAEQQQRLAAQAVLFKEHLTREVVWRALEQCRSVTRAMKLAPSV